jgi:hypothetical protein
MFILGTCMHNLTLKPGQDSLHLTLPQFLHNVIKRGSIVGTGSPALLNELPKRFRHVRAHEIVQGRAHARHDLGMQSLAVVRLALEWHFACQDLVAQHPKRVNIHGPLVRLLLGVEYLGSPIPCETKQNELFQNAKFNRSYCKKQNFFVKT